MSRDFKSLDLPISGTWRIPNTLETCWDQLVQSVRHAGQAQFSTRPGTLGFSFITRYIPLHPIPSIPLHPITFHYIPLHSITVLHRSTSFSIHYSIKSSSSLHQVKDRVEKHQCASGGWDCKWVPRPWQNEERIPRQKWSSWYISPFPGAQKYKKHAEFDFVWKGLRKCGFQVAGIPRNLSKHSCFQQSHETRVSVLDKLCKAFNSHYKAGPTFAIPSMPVPWIDQSWLCWLCLTLFDSVWLCWPWDVSVAARTFVGPSRCLRLRPASHNTS